MIRKIGTGEYRRLNSLKVNPKTKRRPGGRRLAFSTSGRVSNSFSCRS
jgi:hypothetical protein